VAVANEMNSCFIHACDFPWPPVNLVIPEHNIDVELNLGSVSEEEMSH